MRNGCNMRHGRAYPRERCHCLQCSQPSQRDNISPARARCKGHAHAPHPEPNIVGRGWTVHVWAGLRCQYIIDVALRRGRIRVSRGVRALAEKARAPCGILTRGAVKRPQLARPWLMPPLLRAFLPPPPPPNLEALIAVATGVIVVVLHEIHFVPQNTTDAAKSLDEL